MPGRRPPAATNARQRASSLWRRLGRFLRGARASCPLLFLRAGRPRSGPGGRDARAPCFSPSEEARERASSHNLLPAIFSPRSSAPPGSRGRSANSCPAFSSRGTFDGSRSIHRWDGDAHKNSFRAYPESSSPSGDGTRQGQTRIRIGLKDSSRFQPPSPPAPLPQAGEGRL